jgi:hypothetical protein
MPGLRALCRAATLLALVVGSPLQAHEGHDHGPPPVAAAISDGEALAGQTARFEIVARQVGDDLVVTLDRRDSNAPVVAASVSVRRDGKAISLQPTASGTYAAKIALIGAVGTYQLEIVATFDGHEDRLAGALVVAASGGAAVPHRHPDGAVYLGKAAQHLLEVRTVVATTAEAAPSREIVGRVIPDPNGFARVQATRDGRIDPPEEGFPHLGQKVGRDEVLAVLVPTLTTVEEASLREKLIQVERDMAALVPRADAIGIVNPNMPMSDAAAGVLQDLQIQSQGLRRQQELIKSVLDQRIPIKASIDGVIANVRVTAGQVVGTREVLFEVVNRDQALVEGFSFEPVDDIAAASGLTDDGRAVKLAFMGRSNVLRQQAIPLLFRVTEGAAGLDIGTPVRVLAATAHHLRGIKLPRAAVQRGFGSLPVVWEHTAPETFVPHLVTVAPLDADNVLITAGLTDGMRLVATGAQFVNQVR